MKIFKKSVLILLLIVAFVVGAALIYGFYLKPKYEGELQLKNIQKETTVYFDEFGVPHIYATNSQDAMMALGYVHAQDRLWQMELMRRIAPGRLSEIFGSVALKNDKFFAGLGIEEASTKAIAALDKISLSPNPAIDEIAVESKDINLENISVEVMDYFGRTHPSTLQLRSKDKLSVDVNQLPAGIFFLKLMSDGKLVKVVRFVKVG